MNTSAGKHSSFGLAPFWNWKAVLLPGSKQFCESVVPALRKKWLVQTSRNCWASNCSPGFTIKLSVLQKTKGGSMRSYSMDSETSAPKDTGRIGNVAKANGRNESQPQSPPPCSGGVQP